MEQKKLLDRDQIQMMSMDMLVASESVVRVLDVFLEFALDNDLGFEVREQRTGRLS